MYENMKPEQDSVRFQLALYIHTGYWHRFNNEQKVHRRCEPRPTQEILVSLGRGSYDNNGEVLGPNSSVEVVATQFSDTRLWQRDNTRCVLVWFTFCVKYMLSGSARWT